MDPSFLLAFPLLLALSTPCNACNCKIEHPQTYYCTSDIGELGKHQRSLHQGGLTLGYRNVEVGELWWSEQCDPKTLDEEILNQWTSGPLTHFFFLPVILADILGPGNNTITRQGFRVNVIKVNSVPPFLKQDCSNLLLLNWVVSGALKLLWKPKVLATLSLPSQVLKAPRSTPRIHDIYSPISWKDCGYKLRTTQQSLLLIAGEHPCPHTASQPCCLSLKKDHLTSTANTTKDQGPFLHNLRDFF